MLIESNSHVSIKSDGAVVTQQKTVRKNNNNNNNKSVFFYLARVCRRDLLVDFIISTLTWPG